MLNKEIQFYKSYMTSHKSCLVIKRASAQGTASGTWVTFRGIKLLFVIDCVCVRVSQSGCAKTFSFRTPFFNLCPVKCFHRSLGGLFKTVPKAYDCSKSPASTDSLCGTDFHGEICHRKPDDTSQRTLTALLVFAVNSVAWCRHQPGMN